MVRCAYVFLACLASLVFLSGQSIDQTRGFRVKPKLKGGPFPLVSVIGIPDKVAQGPSQASSTVCVPVSSTDANGNVTTSLECVTCTQPACPPPISFANWPGVYPPDVQQQALLNLINSSRQTSGASNLNWHTGLAKAAIDHLQTDSPDPLNSDTIQFQTAELNASGGVSCVATAPLPCYTGYSNIFQNLSRPESPPPPFPVPPNVGPREFGFCPIVCAGIGAKAELSQLFVTQGRVDLYKNVSSSVECNCRESWNIMGRLHAALPRVNFTDLAIILAQQDAGAGGTGSASSFYYGGIITSKYAVSVVQNPKLTTFGCSFDSRIGTWVLVFGENVQPGI